MSEEERKVLAEIDDWLSTSCFETFTLTRRSLQVIHAAMSRPALPEEPDEGHIAAMMAAYPRSHTPREVAYDGYRALYRYMTVPKTKEIEVWHVSYVGRDGPAINVRGCKILADDEAHRLSLLAKVACIRVTGPHKQQVPA